MWVYDTETLRFLQVNNAALARYGFSREQFLDMTVADLGPDAAAAAAVDAPTPGKPQAARHRTANGEIIGVEYVAYDIFSEGRPARVVVVAASQP